jgi:hypothetical protein
VKAAILFFSLAVAASGSVVSTNAIPRLREIGVSYFDALDQSQVWMNVSPELPKPDPAPIILNVTVAFHGLELKAAPTTVRVRAGSVSGTFPLRMRQPILRFVIDRSTTIDLTGPGSTYQFISSSKDGAVDTIVTELPFDSLRQIARATDVTLDALGFSMPLAPADLAAWGVFIHTVEDGVVVRP